MSGDYVYPMTNMVELAGKSLKSKRHARSKFLRDYPDNRAELFEDRHLQDCYRLLDLWQANADRIHTDQITEDDDRQRTQVLRTREVTACRMALENWKLLELKGVTLYVRDQLIGFTLGEHLSPAQASILFEKTHPDYHGSAQLICSEFCRLSWGEYPEVNFGDDWGIPTLRFTKESYRPSRRLSKYVLAGPISSRPTFSTPDPETVRRFANTPQQIDLNQAANPNPNNNPNNNNNPNPNNNNNNNSNHAHVTLRQAARSDLPALLEIEQSCFCPSDGFSSRQIRDLIDNDHAICRVAEDNRRVVGWCVALVRRHPRLRSGRLYTLAVAPAHRGRGVAKRLARHLLDEMNLRGVRNVYLEVRTENQPAVTLYRRLGFHTNRNLDHYYGPDTHGLSMRLTLESATTPSQFLLFAEP
jgi:ribosomal protein S18 acetylase RimI-like enzyme